MKTIFAGLVGVLLVAVATGQACDPSSAALELFDLSTPIGELACKVPSSVDLTAVLTSLSGTLGDLTLEQLKQMPALVEATITVNPTALQPFLSLSAAELNALLPLLIKVGADKLKVVLPLLAQQPEGTLDKMIQFLNGVSLQKLEQLSPLFGSLTQDQVNLMVNMLNTMPAYKIQKLTALMRAIGPVTDVAVSGKQRLGFFLPNWSSRSSIGAGRVGLFRVGRKLKQQACVAADKGIEVGAGLLSNPDLGNAVCKFGAQELLPVMQQLLAILNKQSAETLGNLPALTQSLTKVQPGAIEALFKVPMPTLKALAPLLEGLDPKVVTSQLKALASASSDTIEKIIYFTNNTPEKQLAILVPMFSRLRSDQITTLTNILNTLSPGQITLALHLLNSFGFNMDTIQSNVPAAATSTAPTAASNTFNIGPIRVTVGPRTASSSSAQAGAASAAKQVGFLRIRG